MKNIVTQLAPRFVVQYTWFIDGGRGEGAHYSTPAVVAVTNTLDEAFDIAAAMGDEESATVLEVYNPVLLNGTVTRVPPKVHEFPAKVIAKKVGPKKKKVTPAKRGDRVVG